MDVAKASRSEAVVLVDVGGTNARFAVLRAGTLGPVAHMAVADYGKFADALAAFLADGADRRDIRHAVLGVAGVVESGRCALTNNSWIVDADELRARFGLTNVQLVNDFEALAWSLPNLAASDLRMIGGGSPEKHAPMVVLGAGTGFGVAAYVHGAFGGSVVRSEGGHSTLPGGSVREDAIIKKLRQQFGHVSVERALSGGGLEN